MTWVISAGVVVLFSAISFSAGYMLGREVGKTETGSGIGSVFGDGGSSGKLEAIAMGYSGGRIWDHVVNRICVAWR
ncbi:hypothetical protein PHISP_04141 [Aspergillus sp. HF37]|nr:hypothetical protein PHISP_04141 [Aspergillus sp. HF37]